jgi:hypothetical protein
MFKRLSRRFAMTIAVCVTTLGIGAATAYATPSCRSTSYSGNSGKISVQASSNGFVTWGIYMNDSWNA